MMFKTIILDFDGTIVESVGIKDAAFKALFGNYSDHFDEIMSYHLSNNATIRFEKFEHIYRNILRLPYTPEIRQRLSKEFSTLVFEKIIACPLVPGAIDFLEYYQKIAGLYLISVSPEKELNNILTARNLMRYFKKVYSFEWKKPDAISDILQLEGISPEEAIFIGDTSEDACSAKKTNVFFIGRNSGKPFENINFPILKDLAEIKNYLMM